MRWRTSAWSITTTVPTRPARRPFMSRRRWRRERAYDPPEHKLWLQLKACSRDEGHALKQLEKAWAQGVEHRMNEGFRTAEDLIADAVERAYQWEDRLTEGKDGLLDTEMLVMSYVIAFIEKRQMSRVTCSVREVGEFTGLPKSTAYRALKSLTEKDFLVQVSRGTSSKKPGNRRAAIYGLGDPLNLGYGGRGGPTDRADVWVWKQFFPDRDADHLVRAVIGGSVCGVRAWAPTTLS